MLQTTAVLPVSSLAFATTVHVVIFLVRRHRTPQGLIRWTLTPSGSVAHPIGMVGFVMMAVPVVYGLRKRWKALERFGSIGAWIDVHIFCGIVEPVLVTFHVLAVDREIHADVRDRHRDQAQDQALQRHCAGARRESHVSPVHARPHTG